MTPKAIIPAFTEATMEQKLKHGIDVLRDCARRGAAMNPPMREWFEGYEKACSDIKRAVVDAAFKGRPLPEHWRPNEKRGLTTIITRTTDHGKAEDAFNAE